MADALKWRNKEKHEDAQLFLIGIREVCYYAAAPHSKNLKRKNIFELESDRDARKRKIKSMNPIEVTVDGKAQ